MGLVSEEELFAAALQQPAAERAAFLKRACGEDTQLLAQVEALLAAHARPDSLFDGPAYQPTIGTPPIQTEPLGTSIGPYKLREVLGEGGMGIVYAAEQEQPIRRKVALKIIKPGMDSKEVVARFEAERQALALMDHPHIAKVIDAGTTDSGRPYFVMELVRGLPITEYCDQRRLSPRDRLTLFITVCQALQHAHQKGIVHRDLKPSNVMITLHDGVPVPKIIDFGVAKALNQRLTDHTLYTRVAQLLGTPMYMSPEQAELSGLEIDTRSDVYSLGVLLYELLTGQTPFDKETFSKLGYDELRRMIREDEPPRPSQRLSTLSVEARTTTAQRRGGDDRQLARALRGELDWIVMKALEKDRTRRYGSADGLAADLQAYLADQPVQACPPSYVYRLQKFARRKRGLLSTLALLAICAPLAVLGVHSLIKTSASQPVIRHVASPDGTSPTSDQGKESRPAAAPKAHLNARAPGRYLPGLIPEPPLIPDVGRWQMIPKKPRGRLYSAVWSPDERWIALGETVNVRIYDASSMQLVRVLVGHTAPVFSVAWHPSGERLASAGEDGTVRLWTSDGVPTHLLEGHLGPVYQVAWRPDGERLASVSADGSVRTWNADGSPHLVLDTRHEVVGTQGYHAFCVDWSPDGKLLASGGGDMCPPFEGGPYGDTTVKIWDAERGSLVRQCDGGMKHSVLCVDWCPDGQQLAAGYGEVFRNVQSGASPLPGGGIRIWNLDGTPGPEIRRDGGSINAVAWDTGGHRLAFAPYSGLDGIWKADDQSISAPMSGAGYVYFVAWNRDSSRLLVTHREALTELDAKLVRTNLTENLRKVAVGEHMSWSPDGKYIGLNAAVRLYLSSDGTPASLPDRSPDDSLSWLDLHRSDRRPDGTPAPRLQGVSADIKNWSWSENSWLAGFIKRVPGQIAQTAWIWDDQGNLVTIIRDLHRGALWTLAWSPEGDALVTAGSDTLRLWQRDGSRGPALNGHTHEGTTVAWSPDGHWIASGGLDSTIRLWKRDGTSGPILGGQNSGTVALAFSPDSRHLVSCSYMPDCTFRLWNIETAKIEWETLYSETDAVTLSPAGTVLHGDHDQLESEFLYLIEQRDGSVKLLSFGEFSQQYTLKLDKRRVLALVDAGNVQEAVRLFDRVTAYDPQRKLTWEDAIGEFFLKHRQYVQAVIVFSSIMKTNSSWHIIKRRGAAYMGLKEYDKALADITRAVEMKPDDVSNFTWFPQELLWESPPEVQEAFFNLATKAIALSPVNYAVRATYYLHRGDYQRAHEDLAAAVEQNPNDAVLHNNMAWLLATYPDPNLPDPTKAVQLAERSVELDPRANYVWNTLGAARYRNGDWPGALEALQKSMDIRAGGDSFDWFFLAMTYWQLGQKTEACLWYEKAVEWMEKNAPHDEELLRFRAEASELLGMTAKDDEPADAAGSQR